MVVLHHHPRLNTLLSVGKSWLRYRCRDVFVVFFISVATLPAQPVNADDAARLKELKREIRQLQNNLAETTAEYSALDKQLEQSDQAIARVTTGISSTERQLATQRQRLSDLKQKQTQLQSKQTLHKEKLGQQLNKIYQLEQSPELKLWLSDSSAGQTQRDLRYYDYFNRARSDQINRLIDELQQLTVIQLDIVEQQQQLQQSGQQLRIQRGELQQQRRQQNQLLVKLEAQLSSDQARLEQKRADQRRLEKLLEKMQFLLTETDKQFGSRPFGTMRGKLPRPTSGRVLNAFGSVNQVSRSLWRGWQIATKEGQEVTAVHHGRVVFSDWLRGFGLLLIIDHGDGFLSLYAHNQRLFKEVGSWINSGDIIATSGRSGGLSKSRLYFEIRHQGKPQDPAVWLTKR